MKRGPKGPHTDNEILSRLIELALQEPRLLGKEIREKLEQEFGFIQTPGLRTVQHYMVKAREQAKDDVGEQPWSLGIMARADTGIPWEAVPFLLQCFHEFCLPSLDEIISQTEEEARTTGLESENISLHQSHVIPFSILWAELNATINKSLHSINFDETPIRFEKIAELLKSPDKDNLERICKIKYIRTDETFTVRQAKWLWQTRLALPTLPLPESFKLLCSIAYEYALGELIADYLGLGLNTFNLDIFLFLFTAGFSGKTFAEVVDERRAQNNERTHSQEIQE